MSHYETLGVNPDASPNEIKRAYREKAKTAHPDKGGQQSDFEPIVRAYEVLSNPDRRLLYDTTGQDKQTPIETKIQGLLLQLFNQALAIPDDIPIIRTVRNQLETGKAKMPEEIANLKARKKKLTNKRKTITSKSAVNVIHLIIDGELKNIAGQIANLEEEMKVAKGCLAALKDYSEDWQEPPVIPQFTIYNFGTK